MLLRALRRYPSSSWPTGFGAEVRAKSTPAALQSPEQARPTASNRSDRWLTSCTRLWDQSPPDISSSRVTSRPEASAACAGPKPTPVGSSGPTTITGGAPQTRRCSAPRRCGTSEGASRGRPARCRIRRQRGHPHGAGRATGTAVRPGSQTVATTAGRPPKSSAARRTAAGKDPSRRRRSEQAPLDGPCVAPSVQSLQT
jgi:hypothetical protein